MTNEMMSLYATIENTDNADILREMIGFTAQRLIELEIEGKTGASYAEKNRERCAWLAHHSRRPKTCTGAVIPSASHSVVQRDLTARWCQLNFLPPLYFTSGAHK